VKRLVVLLTGLLAFALPGSMPAAQAVGTAVCSISGTITFTSSPRAPAQGGWSIDPAVIDCRGLFNGWERILGPGSFAGSGSYTTGSDSSGKCVHHIGSGTVDYWIPTSEQDVHMIEPHTFVLTGGGAFSTPTLQGSFELLPASDGGCLANPGSKMSFVAEAVMLRLRPPGVTGLVPSPRQS
jgi:hypothetical protein